MPSYAYIDIEMNENSCYSARRRSSKYRQQLQQPFSLDQKKKNKWNKIKEVDTGQARFIENRLECVYLCVPCMCTSMCDVWLLLLHIAKVLSMYTRSNNSFTCYFKILDFVIHLKKQKKNLQSCIFAFWSLRGIGFARVAFKKIRQQQQQ